MRKVLPVALLLLLLASCTPVEKVEILGVDFGTAEITAGNTFVVVSHDLGTEPTDVQLTLTHDPGANVLYWAKNLTDEAFEIEMSGVSVVDVHFYWRVER